MVLTTRSSKASRVILAACVGLVVLRGATVNFAGGGGNESGFPAMQVGVHRSGQFILGRPTVLATGVASATNSYVPARTGIAASYSVTLQTPGGKGDCPVGQDECEITFECPEDVYVIDQAEMNDIDLPYSCRSGSCSQCVGRVISGKVDQSDQMMLDDDQMAKGYCLVCVSHPRSDVKIRTYVEDSI